VGPLLLEYERILVCFNPRIEPWFFSNEGTFVCLNALWVKALRLDWKTSLGSCEWKCLENGEGCDSDDLRHMKRPNSILRRLHMMMIGGTA